MVVVVEDTGRARRDHEPLCDQPPSNATNPTGALDLIHTNSVSLAPDGTGDLIISARSLDAVLRIRRNPGGADDGRILWKLGGTTPQSNGTVHYTMTGDPLGSFLRQHDAALLANGNVVLFDNQSPPPPRPPTGATESVGDRPRPEHRDGPHRPVGALARRRR